MFDIKLSRAKTLLLLGLFFAFGLILRSFKFTHISFGYDQARDALEAMSIWQQDPIKIIGPMTDLRGLYHGTLYWYLISPFYFFSSGNVLVVKSFLILFNLSIVFVLYFVVKQIFKNNLIALLSALLFTSSFEVVQYARWLSNPSPALLSILLSFYGLWLILNRNYKGIGLFFVFWAISVHFEFFLVYHLFIFLIVFGYLFFSNKIEWKKIFNPVNYILFGITFLILSPFIISEIKFGYQGVTVLSGFLDEDKGLLRVFSPVRDTVVNKFIQNYFLNVFGVNILLAGVMFFLTLIFSVYIALTEKEFKKPIFFTLFLFFLPMLPLSFEKLGAYFIMIGSLYGIIILTSVCMVYLLSRVRFNKKLFLVLIAGIIIIGNFFLSFHNSQNGEGLFSVQNKMLLSDERAAVDWIYKQANGRPFYINSVTNPLFINTTWAFLFDGYGKSSYGYMPGWLGYPQTGVFGEHVEYAKIEKIKGTDLFLIIEPGPGFPEEYAQRYPWYENTRSKLIERQLFGGFVVEHRELTKDQPFDRDALMNIIMGRKTKTK